ncbi:MAG TPA: dephospho-CoA kinase [Dehalococcoidia bacterium]|nr:dephospho-CoA kinase [Dehalococcoidia bacterium]
MDMYVIGLTGGIGSGKSTVAQLLEEQGAVILSADKIGHEVYNPGRPAWQEIVDAFGDEIVAGDGTIDRKKLSAIVFSDPKNLAKLNSIVHPRMKGMMRERLAQMAREGAEMAVLEAALLFEAKWDDLVGEIWVTVAPPEVAAKRTAGRSGLPEAEILARIKSQMSNEERIQQSDVVIETDCPLEETERQALEAWARLKQRLAG